jgi:predicted permease
MCESTPPARAGRTCRRRHREPATPPEVALHPLFAAALALLLPLAVGWMLGAVRLFPSPDAAVGVLNRFALYVGFPLLIVVGIADRGFSIPSEPGFWLAVPAAALLATGALWLLGLAIPALRPARGPLVLTTVWGNVAYIGLPVVAAVLGKGLLGVAALAVALHVLVSMLLGPTLLLTWSGSADGGAALRRAIARVARQPLAWSPLVGLLLRLLPADLLEATVTVIGPLAATAGPVALVLIGLFLHTHRARLRLEPLAGMHVAAKLVGLPLATAAVVVPLTGLELMTPTQAQLLLLLSAMPTAISTFALAVEFDVARERVAVAVVASTALSALWIPAVVWGLAALLPA